MNYDRLLTRVWDKQEKVMIYVGNKVEKLQGYYCTIRNATFIGINGDILLFVDEYEKLLDVNIILSKQDRFVPVQCTGLKDKNGKLIYEGDIVKSPAYDNQMIVEFDNIEPSDDMTAPGAGYQFNTEPDEMEIIGNRWENEKLMEGKA